MASVESMHVSQDLKWSGLEIIRFTMAEVVYLLHTHMSPFVAHEARRCWLQRRRHLGFFDSLLYCRAGAAEEKILDAHCCGMTCVVCLSLEGNRGSQFGRCVVSMNG
jgi:hypothetical protein